jgi:hypothetical protein
MRPPWAAYAVHPEPVEGQLLRGQPYRLFLKKAAEKFPYLFALI